MDFKKLTEHGVKNGLHQALNIPDNSGTAVQYAVEVPLRQTLTL
jgi:hypothetical protein